MAARRHQKRVKMTNLEIPFFLKSLSDIKKIKKVSYFSDPLLNFLSRIDWLHNYSNQASSQKGVNLTFSYKWQLLPFNSTKFNLTLKSVPLLVPFKNCSETYILCRTLVTETSYIEKKYPNFKILFLNDPLIRFQDNLAEMFFEWPSTKTVQAILISLTNRAPRRHQEWCKMTKLCNSILIKVLVRFQDTNGFYW